MSESTGELGVLNVGAGDVVVTFNKHDRGEAAKAIRMLRDMQRAGYAILVQLEDGEYARAVDIDATRGRYILSLPEGEPEQAGADVEPVVSEQTEACGVSADVDGRELVCVRSRFPAHAGKHEAADGTVFAAKRGAKRKGAKTKGGRRGRVAKPIRTSRAVGVARSAGG